MSNPILFDIALAILIILGFAMYQETAPGTWQLIKRILGR